MESLRALAKQLAVHVSLHYGSTSIRKLTLSLQDQVEFILNAPFPQILDLLSRASIGLSTMVDEHFGINVVEFMVRTIRFSIRQ